MPTGRALVAVRLEGNGLPPGLSTKTVDNLFDPCVCRRPTWWDGPASVWMVGRYRARGRHSAKEHIRSLKLSAKLTLHQCRSIQAMAVRLRLALRFQVRRSFVVVHGHKDQSTALDTIEGRIVWHLSHPGRRSKSHCHTHPLRRCFCCVRRLSIHSPHFRRFQTTEKRPWHAASIGRQRSQVRCRHSL